MTSNRLDALRALAAGVAVDRTLEVVEGPAGCGWSIDTHTGRIQVDPNDLERLPETEVLGLVCHEAAHAAMTRYPWLVRLSQRFLTAGCSTREVITWRFSGLERRAAQMAVLSLSVPQLVKTISSGVAPIRPATWARASLRAWPTPPPKACMLEGLPYCSLK